MPFFASLGLGMLTLLIYLLNIYCWVIIASAVLSWGFLPPTGKVMRILRFLTEPVLNPCRQLLYRILPFAWRRLDFSPVLAIFLINVLTMILRAVSISLITG